MANKAAYVHELVANPVYEGDEVHRRLPVKLTQDERLERAERLAKKIVQQKTLAEAAKATAADYKEHQSALSCDVGKLCEIVATGEEPQEVPTRKVRDEERYQILTVRLDTYEVVESRQMTDDEKQPRLFPLDGGAAKKRKRGGHAPTTPEWTEATSAAQEPEPA